MVKESDMELQIMDWLCPECGLELSKHLISTDCPVSDVDEPAEPLKDGEPCSHPGCSGHFSHPCEVCGRIGMVSKRTTRRDSIAQRMWEEAEDKQDAPEPEKGE